jgi:hypothetical protein
MYGVVRKFLLSVSSLSPPSFQVQTFKSVNIDNHSYAISFILFINAKGDRVFCLNTQEDLPSRATVGLSSRKVTKILIRKNIFNLSFCFSSCYGLYGAMDIVAKTKSLFVRILDSISYNE